MSNQVIHQLTDEAYADLCFRASKYEDLKAELEQMRAEITAEVLSHSGTGEEVIQAYVDGLNHSLKMIDKAIEEQTGG